MFIITRTVFVLQAPLSLTHSLIDWVGHPFPPHLQNIINSKVFQLESRTFDRLFTLHHMSCVTCHLLCVTPHLSHFIFFLKEKESLELSLEQYFVHIRGYSLTNVCCSFCGNKFHLERALLKHLNLTNWSSMLEFVQKRNHIFVKSFSASLC